MNHIAKAIVLICMDFRFQGWIRDFMVDNGYNEQYDLISLAGAAKTIANPSCPEDKKVALNQISLSYNLHQIKEVFLINHQNCGAYGPEVSKNPKEFEIHQADLIKAKNEILKQLPGLKVKMFYLTLKKKFNKIE